MIPVIVAVDQITPEWLTAILARDGHLPVGQVQAVSVRHVHDEQVYTISYFLSVDYSSEAPPTAPTRLFLKLPRREIEAAVRAWQGEREVGLYQAVAADQPQVPVIPCYDAVCDPDRGLYHLLLADLSATHDQPTSWTITDQCILQTVECLARFHAYWWEHPRLGQDMGALPTRAWLDEEVARLQQAYSGFARQTGSRLSGDDRHVYERVLDALPRLWADRTVIAGQTLVHGDAHFWNFLYPRDPQSHRTYMLDWQNYHISPGTKDLAYTIVVRYLQRTPDKERVLVKCYYDALRRHGVMNYPWERCWADYRRMAAEHVLYPLRWWMSQLPEEFWERFIAPTLAGFRDLGCADLLDQPR